MEAQQSEDCELYALKDDESPISMLNTDCAKAIFLKLEREAVQKLQRTCKFMRDTYKENRTIIPGPVCNVKIFYNDGVLSLYLGSTTENRPHRLVPLEEWNFAFKNAECNSMYLNCDEELSDDVMRTIMCCHSINTAQYVGKTINQNILDRFAPLIVKSFQVIVDHWHSQLTGFAKFEWLMIDRGINDLNDIIETMKSVSAIEVSMNYTKFVHSIPSLLNLRGQTQCLPYWLFVFKGHPDQSRVELDFSNLKQTLATIYGNMLDFNFSWTPATLYMQITPAYRDAGDNAENNAQI